ncbi:beta-lactamase/transpeptidase-like protein [Trichoderma velutinum]
MFLQSSYVAYLRFLFLQKFPHSMSENHNTREFLHGALQKCLQDGVEIGVPGITAAVASSEGLLWSGTAGLANVETKTPFTVDHVSGIGSITKVFMSVVILQLIDEKKLNIDDTLQQYVSAEVLQGIPHASGATIGQLLSHTSGIPSWEDDPQWIRQGRGSDLDPDKIWTSTETLNYIRYDSNPNLQAPNPKPIPGKYSYSNTNFTFLGLVAEFISSDTLSPETDVSFGHSRIGAASLIRSRVLEPLGLNYTYLEGFESPQAGQMPNRYHWVTPTFLSTAGACPAFSYPKSRPDLLDASKSNMSTEWVAGGNLSHPKDLCALALAIRNAKILSSSSLKLMMTDFIPITERAWVGHGIFKMRTTDGNAWFGHNGSTLGFNGSMFWNEETDVAIAVLGNVGTMHSGKVPGAASVALESEFLALAVKLAELCSEEKS